MNNETLLTNFGLLHNRSIVCFGENRAIVIDICHQDNKFSRILYQLVILIIQLGSQIVRALLLSVQNCGY